MRAATKKVVIAAGAAVVLAAAALLIAAWGGAERGRWTDADTIRVPAAAAPLRQVLWQPAEPLPRAMSAEVDEYEPRLSADGTVMVFVRRRPGSNADLFQSRWSPAGWGEPAAIASINTEHDELGPELSRDGQWLYFYSDRPGGVGGHDLWRARAAGDGWEEPVNAGPAVNSPWNEYGPALSPDGGMLYFSSNRPRPGEATGPVDAWSATVRERRERHDYDLFRAALGHGEPAAAEPIRALNTAADEGAPAMSPAGDFLYFASDRPGGAGGLDIYRARVRGVANLIAENLGPAVNTRANELDPGLSADGFRLVFSSDRPMPTMAHGVGGTAPAASGPGATEGGHEIAGTVKYGLWCTVSREVFFERDARTVWSRLAAAWRGLWPWLLLLAIGLLLMLAVWRAAQDAAMRKRLGRLSLLTQCLLLSLAIHAMLACVAAVWKIGTSLGDFLNDGGGGAGGEGVVVLAAGGDGMDLAGDLHGSFVSDAWTPSLPEAGDAAALPTPMRLAMTNVAMETGDLDRPTPLAAIEGAGPSEALRSADVSPAAEMEALREPQMDAWSPTGPEMVAPAAAVEEGRLETPAAARAEPARGPAVTPPSWAARTVTEPTAIDRVDRSAPGVAAAGMPESATADRSAGIASAAAPVAVERAPGAGDEAIGSAVSLPGAVVPMAAGAERGGARADDRSAARMTAPGPPTVRDAIGEEASPAARRVDLSAAARHGDAPSAAGSLAADAAHFADDATPAEGLMSAAASPPGGSGSAIDSLPTAGEAPAAAVPAPKSAGPSGGANAPSGEPKAEVVAAKVSALAPPSVDGVRGERGAISPPSAMEMAAPARRSAPTAPGAAAGLTADAATAADAAVTAARAASEASRASNPAPASAGGLPATALPKAAGEPREAGARRGMKVEPSASSLDASAPTAGRLPGPTISAPAATDSPKAFGRVQVPMPDRAAGVRQAGSAAGSASPSSAGGAAELPAVSALPAGDAAGSPAAGVTKPSAAGANAGATEPSAGGPDLRVALPPAPAERPKADPPGGPPAPLTGIGAAVANGPAPVPAESFPQRSPEVRGEMLERMGGSERTERAVNRALEWFKRHQSGDGSWSARGFDDACGECGGTGEIDAPVAMTGMVLLCYLGAGHTPAISPAVQATPDAGPYRGGVTRAVRWLVSRQRPDGNLGAGETMYGHTVATVALCEAYAMTRDPALAGPTRRAVGFIVDRTSGDGRGRSDQETSVLGWQVMAMASARRAGIDVPRDTFDMASAWLDQVEARGGGGGGRGRYGYTPGDRPSAAATAEAMFVQQLIGRRREEPRMAGSAGFVLASPPKWREGAPTYHWYYATLALFEHQGEAWRLWNEAIVPELIENQGQTGPAAGSWRPTDRWSKLGGRVYQTAVCALSLEVYYRYRPAGMRGPERE